MIINFFVYLLGVKFQFAVIFMVFFSIQASATHDKENPSIRHVRDFLGSFPHDQIARSSLKCKNYARALLHYEQHMGTDNIQDHLDTLQVS